MVSFLFFIVGAMVVGEKQGSIVRKKSILIPVLFAIIVAVVLLSVASVLIYRKINKTIRENPSITKIQLLWEQQDYLGVFDTSSILIEDKPLNNTILTYRGYAAYNLAKAETDASLAQKYINESIRSLRIALMSAREKTIPQIKYMLGNAYFYKNEICSYYYYADLVVKYLEEAKAMGYKADDIPIHLGISYGQLGLTYESISRFSEALLIRESDSLLLSIAEQYYKQGQNAAAKQYLYQVNSRAQDDNVLLRSQTLLAKIYLEEENYDEAKELFDAVLEKNENSPDAHYGLGVIFEKKGDMVKARAEWRKTLKIDSTYEAALKKVYR